MISHYDRIRSEIYLRPFRLSYSAVRVAPVAVLVVVAALENEP